MQSNAFAAQERRNLGELVGSFLIRDHRPSTEVNEGVAHIDYYDGFFRVSSRIQELDRDVRRVWGPFLARTGHPRGVGHDQSLARDYEIRISNAI